MASAQWPESLPQLPVRGGYGRKKMSQKKASKTDKGLYKVRRRYTGTVFEVTATYKLTETQKAAFQEFHDDTLGDGILSFDWPDPESGTDPLTLTEVRFKPDEQTSYELKPSGARWVVTVTLWTLPSVA